MDFAAEEEKTLQFWSDINAFKTSNRLAKNRPTFTFYDGPPFATGLPHYGHLLAGTVKDTVTRWAMQTGYSVNRRFGWDCHGLPIEHEVDKQLGIQHPKEIEEKYGIAEYNRLCRETAMKYASVWQEQITRMGRWIEFENDYKTLYPWYMESVWWVFKQLFIKGLVYRGVKVMPYSTGCATPLSNFEANQNYKQVQDPSVVVAFRLKSGDASLVAWTTTPWTLPSNLALCVHPDRTYCRVRSKETCQKYICLRSRVAYLVDESCSKGTDDYVVEEEFKGATLSGLEYEPLFPYFVDKVPKGFRVLTSDYVTEDVGTGVVHQAPYFGEDDYRVCLENGVIRKDQGLLACPLDSAGKFVAPVTDYEGMYVKTADKQIIRDLDRMGHLIRQSQVNHSYPFCWRSETPLIYRAVPSWFIQVDPEAMVKVNETSLWVPSYVQEGRFGNWLRDARDWCISRNRYWGNPIPIWVSEDSQEIVCIGSIEELERLSGKRPGDLHRDNIDDIVIPSKRPGHPPLRRTTEVFDCWFESGAMPYAQAHYPFDDGKLQFPADFVSEGIDQTRGWFYTLLVLSTALFRKSPFRNVIVTGLILAADGEKMSKRLRNYPDPMEVVHKYGADALRLYLISSPAVKAECLKFREEGVKEIQRDVFIPWVNALRFLQLNIARLEKEDGVKFFYDQQSLHSDNVMDRWIVSYTNSCILFMREQMTYYRLYAVVPRLIQFVDLLTNWYVRLNRPVLKGDFSVEECQRSLSVLYYVLFTMAHMTAPFTPFLAEHFYQKLKKYDNSLWLEADQSVHFRQIPPYRAELVDRSIEKAVSAMRTVIETGRTLREKHRLPLRQPLKQFTVVSREEKSLKYLRCLRDFIVTELNVKKFETSTNKELYDVVLQVTPDFKRLGSRARDSMKLLTENIRNMSESDYESLQTNGHFIFPEIPDIEITPDDVNASYAVVSKQRSHLIGDISPDKTFICVLNTELVDELKNEKLIKDVCNRIQRMRKAAKLVQTDPIKIFYKVEPADCKLAECIREHSEMLLKLVKRPVWQYPVDGQQIADQSFEIEDGTIRFTIVSTVDDVSKPIVAVRQTLGRLPSQPFVNVIFTCGTVARKRYGQPICQGSVFLHSGGKKIESVSHLCQTICVLFGIDECELEIFKNGQLEEKLQEDQMIDDLNGLTLFAREKDCLHDNIPVECLTYGGSPLAQFTDCLLGNRRHSVFIENPLGCRVATVEELCDRVRAVCCVENFDLYTDRELSRRLTFSDLDWTETIFVSC